MLMMGTTRRSFSVMVCSNRGGQNRAAADLNVGPL
jgi:hypothetical protein